MRLATSAGRNPPEIAWWRTIFLTLALFFAFSASAFVEETSQVESLSNSSGLVIEQHLFIDSSGEMNFQQVLAEKFGAFDPLQRMDIDDKTAWLRLSIKLGKVEPHDLFIRLLPPLFDDVYLYTPDRTRSDGWLKKRLTQVQNSKFVPIGKINESTQIYLQIKSSYKSGLWALAGTHADLSQQNHRLDVITAVIATMLIFTWLSMLLKVFTRYSQLLLVTNFFLPFILFRFCFLTGNASYFLNLPASRLGSFYAPLVSASTICAGLFIIFLAKELLQNPRFFIWWVYWIALGALNVVVSIFQPSWSLRFLDWLLPFTIMLLLGSIGIGVWKNAKSFNSWQVKKNALSLLYLLALFLILSINIHGFSLGNNFATTYENFEQRFITRTLALILLVILANLIQERFQNNRFKKLQIHSLNTTALLESESRRLKRQRNFVVMLAHELKNPLTVSQMALLNIGQRLGKDDPAQDRIKRINTSLEEINSIVERCVEIDYFEQGQLQMKVITFTVSNLIEFILAANTNERIYFLTRNIKFDTTITSDLDFIKIILNNLVSNALKYSPPDSLVELEFSCLNNDHGAHIDVTVSNVLADAETPDVSRLFEQFYRAESSRRTSGAGLGLWLSQSLAKELNTVIKCSINDHQIRFSVRLKADDAQH
jgi:signal transduction histidine kinase